MSHPTVHPVEALPPMTIKNAAAAAGPVPRVRMKDLQGMASTPGWLMLRHFQSFFAIGDFLVMSTTSDFPVTAFRLAAAMMVDVSKIRRITKVFSQRLTI